MTKTIFKMRTKAEPTKKAMLNNTENDADIRVPYEYIREFPVVRIRVGR